MYTDDQSTGFNALNREESHSRFPSGIYQDRNEGQYQPEVGQLTESNSDLAWDYHSSYIIY